MSKPISARTCKAHNPATCPYHRNGVMGGLHQQAADAAVLRGDTNTAIYHADQARQYNLRQEAVDAGDFQSVADFTRADIAQDKANAKSKHMPVLGTKTPDLKKTKFFKRPEITFDSKQWQEFQEAAVKREVDLTYDAVIDQGGKAVIKNMTVKGQYNDISYMHALSGRFAARATPPQFEQRTMTRGAVGGTITDMTVSKEKWSRIQAATSELEVSLEGGHYDQQADGSINLKKVKMQGDPKDVALAAAAFDTPTEHVATIPSFEDFKRSFFGRK